VLLLVPWREAIAGTAQSGRTKQNSLKQGNTLVQVVRDSENEHVCFGFALFCKELRCRIPLGWSLLLNHVAKLAIPLLVDALHTILAGRSCD
jgi:hypothetical protein